MRLPCRLGGGGRRPEGAFRGEQCLDTSVPLRPLRGHFPRFAGAEKGPYEIALPLTREEHEVHAGKPAIQLTTCAEAAKSVSRWPALTTMYLL